MKLFDDRGDAGRQLAQRLAQLSGKAVVVLGLPRGGVPVAFEVAKSLQAPLDVLVVRKLGVPFQPELAFGAIGEDGVRVLNDDVVRGTHLDAAAMDAVERKQLIELQRRAERFRRGRDRIPLTGRIAVIVDDGIATGATAKAACQVARAHGADKVVLAVPIGPDDIVARFAGYADEVVCLATPALFFASGKVTATSPRPPTTRWWRFWIVLTATSPRQVRSMPPLTHRFAMRRSRSLPVQYRWQGT